MDSFCPFREVRIVKSDFICNFTSYLKSITNFLENLLNKIVSVMLELKYFYIMEQ